MTKTDIVDWVCKQRKGMKQARKKKPSIRMNQKGHAQRSRNETTKGGNQHGAKGRTGGSNREEDGEEQEEKLR